MAAGCWRARIRLAGKGWGCMPEIKHLVSQLSGRQMLLVLDNFEHLLPGRVMG
jgi:hypothetical protein